MTQHRCVSGGWRDGKVKDCGLCRVERTGKGKRAKRGLES